MEHFPEQQRPFFFPLEAIRDGVAALSQITAGITSVPKTGPQKPADLGPLTLFADRPSQRDTQQYRVGMPDRSGSFLQRVPGLALVFEYHRGADC